MHILIAYASVHGSTAEVAHFMGQVLEGQGMKVTVSSIDLAASLDDYDAIILGSAIHNGMLLPEMGRFVRLNRQALESKPIYLWVTCIRILEPFGFAHVLQNYIPGSVFDQLPLRGIQVFAGKLNLADTDSLERWSLSLRYDGTFKTDELQGDHRDWEAIRGWTNQVAQDLVQEWGLSTH